jgi:hypothetical protein
MPDATDFAPERWEISNGDTPAAPLKRPRPALVGQAGKFLKGPVNWNWLLRAMRRPGKALALGLMLWKEAGCEGGRTIHFCLSGAAAEGIPLTTARRAMNALEAAGLVCVERKPGRGLEVTILDPPGEE